MLIANAPANAHVHAIDPFLAGRIGICWGKFIADREIARARRWNPSIEVSNNRNYSQNMKIPV